MPVILPQAFDSAAFGVPFYRITDWDEFALAAELPALVARRPIVIDAKLPAEDGARVAFLQRFGFRSVALQVVLHHDLVPSAKPSHAIVIAASLPLLPAAIARHAANFRFDRFSADPLLPRAGRDRLYQSWIANSLDGRAEVAHQGEDFCTFRCVGTALTIDLLSVLRPRQGIGRSLVRAVLEEARARGLAEARVVTERANEAALRLYVGAGFVVSGEVNCLHFVAT